VNDPNGLVHAGGAYRLFAQHSSSAEDRSISWCRWSSSDLLQWHFDGPVISADGDRWMYSGSVLTEGDDLLAFHTIHRAGLEDQVVRSSRDAGRSWTEGERLTGLGPAARNRRDPFVFRDAEGWALLLAEPCDWSDWPEQSPSRLLLYRSRDGRDWREAGSIGPWRPRGVMWEVPVLAKVGGHDVLFISEVDRRADLTSCSVRAWIGRLGSNGFALAPHAPLKGQLVDLGPDFYAMVGSGVSARPGGQQLFVGWASSWKNARTRRWPGFYGGPVSLPRTIRIDDAGGAPMVMVQPAPAIIERFTEEAGTQPVAGLGRLKWQGDRINIRVSNGSGSAEIELRRKGFFAARRNGAPPMQWQAAASALFAEVSEVLLFMDGPLIELFVGGVSLVMALEEEGVLSIACTADDVPVTIRWSCMAPPEQCTG
jgi:levanase/fructan beta-fructosidase